MVEEATNIDHIDNDATNNAMDNLMSLCQTCHSKKTGQESKGLPVTIYGTGLDGYPLDPKSEEFKQRKKNHGELRATNRHPSHTHVTAK